MDVALAESDRVPFWPQQTARKQLSISMIDRVELGLCKPLPEKDYSTKAEQMMVRVCYCAHLTNSVMQQHTSIVGWSIRNLDVSTWALAGPATSGRDGSLAHSRWSASRKHLAYRASAVFRIQSPVMFPTGR